MLLPIYLIEDNLKPWFLAIVFLVFKIVRFLTVSLYRCIPFFLRFTKTPFLRLNSELCSEFQKEKACGVSKLNESISTKYFTGFSFNEFEIG